MNDRPHIQWLQDVPNRPFLWARRPWWRRLLDAVTDTLLGYR